MKYTFLLPAYKAKYLKEALDSIQRQTFRDFLVLISDDCSPENLYSIVQPYLLDSRFSYRKNEKNLGGESLVAHWNLLVGLCESEFLITKVSHSDKTVVLQALISCKSVCINNFRK